MKIVDFKELLNRNFYINYSMFNEINNPKHKALKEKFLQRLEEEELKVYKLFDEGLSVDKIISKVRLPKEEVRSIIEEFARKLKKNGLSPCLNGVKVLKVVIKNR